MNGSSYKSSGGANGAIRKSGLNGLTNGGTNGYHHPDLNLKLNGTHTVKPIHTAKPGTVRPVKTGTIGMFLCQFAIVFPARMIWLQPITWFLGVGLPSGEVQVDVGQITPIQIQPVSRGDFDNSK